MTHEVLNYSNWPLSLNAEGSPGTGQVFCLPVANKALVVSEAFREPFDFRDGKPSALGVFAMIGATAIEQIMPPPVGTVLEFWPRHYRSLVAGRTELTDSDGNRYRDIDIKGIGLVADLDLNDPTTVQVGRPGRLNDYAEREGLLERDFALTDYVNTEEFIRAGIRTSGRTVAILELDEIVYDRETITVDEAKRKGIIDEEYRPVLQVRAYQTKARIDDLENNKNMILPFVDFRETVPKDPVEYARNLVAQELGKEHVSETEYLKWFSKTLGENIGLMHSLGLAHNYLTGHNITVDCRFVDLDGVCELTEEKRKVDLDEALIALLCLINSSQTQPNSSEVWRKYIKRFLNTYTTYVPQLQNINFAMRFNGQRLIMDTSYQLGAM